jgi:hypothetical protein
MSYQSRNLRVVSEVYGKVDKLLPTGAPKPFGNAVTYTDANLYHDMLTGWPVPGKLHICNQTPVDWFSKRQATVETARLDHNLLLHALPLIRSLI